MNIGKFLIKENNNLDFIRIVCASMVIIGHAYILNPSEGHIDLIEWLTGFTYSGSLAVELFFFISGILVTESLLRKKSIVSFVISRLFRMIPGLLFVLLITTFILGPLLTEIKAIEYFKNRSTYTYLFTNISLFKTDYLLPGVFIKNYYQNIVNGSLWSLKHEARYYFITLAIFITHRCLLKKVNISYVYNIVVLYIFMYTILELIIAPSGKSLEFNLLPVSFASGSLLAVHKKHININYAIVSVFVLLTVVFWRTAINRFIFNISASLLVIVLAENKYIKKIKIKSDISYGIYLWGFFVQQTIFHFVGCQNTYIFIFESLSLSYIMGFLSFILVEKRFMSYGRKLDANLRKGERFNGLVNIL